MRVALRFVETHWNQAIPGVVIEIRGRHAYRYLINTPAHTDRFLQQHKLTHNPNTVFLFSRSTTDLVSGLAPLIYSQVKDRPRAYPKIIGDSNLFAYMEQLRYKLGFESVNYSYASWQGQYRKGISCSNTIASLQSKTNSSEIFDSLQAYITNKLENDKKHSVLDFYNPISKIYEDGFVKIQIFQTGDLDKQISHFIFSIKKDPSLSSLPILGNLNTKQFNCSFAILYHTDTNSFSNIIKNKHFLRRIKQSQPKTIVHLFEEHSISYCKQFVEFVKILPQSAQNIAFTNLLKNSSDKIHQFSGKHKYLDLISLLQKKYPLYFPNISKNMQNIQKKMWNNKKIIQQLFSTSFKVHKPNSEYVLLPESERGLRFPINTSNLIQLSQDHSLNQNRVTGRDSIRKILKECDPLVTFLGTASSFSNLYRSVSCILVDIENSLFMFDCGEGAYGQFSTHFGQNTNSKILQTKVIFVTHCHSDHVLGIMEFISKRNKAAEDINKIEKLFLVIPANVIPWFHHYCINIEDVSKGCQIIFVEGLLEIGEEQNRSQQSVKINNCKTGKIKSAYFHRGKQQIIVHDPFSLQIQFHVLMIISRDNPGKTSFKPTNKNKIFFYKLLTHFQKHKKLNHFDLYLFYIVLRVMESSSNILQEQKLAIQGIPDLLHLSHRLPIIQLFQSMRQLSTIARLQLHRKDSTLQWEKRLKCT